MSLKNFANTLYKACIVLGIGAGIAIIVKTMTNSRKGFDEEGSHYFTVVTNCENGESLPSDVFEFEIKGESIEEMENRFEIYPNPVVDVLYIKLNDDVKEIKKDIESEK